MADRKSEWFAGFFEKHRRSLRRYLSRLVSSSDVAEDLAQEAFARIYAVRTEALQSPQSFLYRTAHNLAMDHVRHRRIAAEDPLDSDLASSIGHEAPSAEDWIASKQELDLVHAAIQELPPKCRMVFIMLRFEERSYKEIAHSMALSETMVRKYAVRALEHCLVRLDREQTSRRRRDGK
jgi:RNA polymerase sigma factor (sigma-70 family)